MNRRLSLSLAFALALVACSKRTPDPAPAPRDNSSPTGSSTTPDASSPIAAFAIPPATKQLLVAITADWDATNAELRLYTRTGDAWSLVGDPWRGVVGRTGTAWGAGLHGRGAPTGRSGPSKHEGDGKSPAGAFALTSAFGYTAAPPTGTTLGYQQVDANWKCVDDPSSRDYNRVLDQRTTTVDWTSAEDMRRTDDHYAWVVEVAHNAARTPEDGSCIFLHVWGGPDSATVGCTAMEEPRLASLIAQLRPADAPLFVLLPRAEYTALAPLWHLP